MTKECIGWVWYLANDFQFFLITPPLLWLYCKNRIAGYSLIIGLLSASMLFNGIFAAVFNVGIDGNSKKVNGGNWMYSKPWSRGGAYLVGVLFGLSYFELSCKDKYPQLKNTISNIFYDRLKVSRISSIIVFLVGVGLTALFVFPTRNFALD